jgi:hypothetical protein
MSQMLICLPGTWEGNGTSYRLQLAAGTATDFAIYNDGSGDSKFVGENVEAAGSDDAGLVLDLTKTVLTGATALQQYQGNLTVGNFEKVFGPVFTALGVGADATALYQQFQTDLAAAGDDQNAIIAAWNKKQ